MNRMQFVYFVGNGLCAVPSAQRHPPDGTECPVEWNMVRPHRKHLLPIQRTVPIPGAGWNGTQAVPLYNKVSSKRVVK